MRKLCSVLCYEYKMQIKRPAVWGVLLVTVAMAQLDNFPSAQNLARLEFLNQPAYFVCRVMSLDALLLFFGLAILLANRFPTDRKNGMKHLFLSYPLEKTAYILGKLLGGFCVAFSMAFLFLTLNTAVYFRPAGLPDSAGESAAVLRASGELVCGPDGRRFARRAGYPDFLCACSRAVWLQRRVCGLSGNHAVLSDHRRRPYALDLGSSEMALCGFHQRGGQRRFPPDRGTGFRKPAFL